MIESAVTYGNIIIKLDKSWLSAVDTSVSTEVAIANGSVSFVSALTSVKTIEAVADWEAYLSHW
jgi:hypothetical protein